VNIVLWCSRRRYQFRCLHHNEQNYALLPDETEVDAFVAPWLDAEYGWL
jgi:hypothetical protein